MDLELAKDDVDVRSGYMIRSDGCIKLWTTANARGGQGSEHGIAVGMDLDLT